MKKFTHGGYLDVLTDQFNIRRPNRIVADFSVNLNPVGMPYEIKSAILRSLMDIHKYPLPYPDIIEKDLANKFKLEYTSFIVGCGATDLMGNVIDIIKPKVCAWSAPSYIGYKEICESRKIKGVPFLNLKLDEKSVEMLKNTEWDVLFICNPNNPTGTIIDNTIILKIAKEFPLRWIIVDESFIDFCEDSDSFTMLNIRNKFLPNLIIIKSFTKFFACAGVRIGFLYADPSITNEVRRRRLPWELNTTAVEVLKEICLMNIKSFKEKTVSYVKQLKKKLIEILEEHNFTICYNSHTNFILCKVPSNKNENYIFCKLLKDGIMVRKCGDFDGLDDHYFRIAVRPESEIFLLSSSLKRVFKLPAKKKAKSLIVIGTSSGVGKSIITSAICGYLSSKGVKVTPFKAINLTCRSFTTKDGIEISTAQAFQAFAAGIKIEGDINPVLIKPIAGGKYRIILKGKTAMEIKRKDFSAFKENFIEIVSHCYDRLASKFEVVVIEGAGSPVEFNILDSDISNIFMADYSCADIILVADINSGGVFSGIFGTVALLAERHREKLKGVIINKFKGRIDNDLIKICERITGVKVLGAFPYLKNLLIPEEDDFVKKIEKSEIYKKAGNFSNREVIRLTDALRNHVSLNFIDEIFL